jgi:hypothetical protein
MGLRIYIHNCRSGGYHIGCFIDKEGLDERTLQKYEHGYIESLVRVKLNDGVPITWAEIDKAVDEAFVQVCQPIQDDFLYQKNVSNGLVEVLPKGLFGKDASDVKKVLRDVVDVLLARGRRIVVR